MLKTTRLFARKLAFRCAALMSAGVRQVALGDYRARIASSAARARKPDRVWWWAFA